MRRVVKKLALLVMVLMSARPLVAQSGGYQYQGTITINHTKVPNTDQTDFPVLISGVYANLATVAHGGFVQNSNGYDIIFCADPAGSTKLDHEIDNYDPATGTVGFWVRIPTLSHTTDTTVYIFYGNPSITTSQENKPGVWRNGYGGVWHFGTSTSLSTSDSSGNANSGTNNGATAAAGMFGGAGSFNGSSSSITIPDNASIDPAQITVSLWFKYAGNPWANTPITKPYNGPVWGSPYVSNLLRVDFYGSNMEFDVGNGSTFSNYQPTCTTVPGDWYYALYTYDGTTLRAYMNGSLVGTNTSVSGNIAYNGYGSPPWIIGADYSFWQGYFDGLIDEVHISSTARSADWIATEYANQSSPSTFYTTTLAGNGYAYRETIALDHTKVPNTDQTDFPVLISGVYPNLATVAHGGFVQNSNGYDIIFSADPAGSTKLDHEIDNYDPTTGTVGFWVRIPTLSHTADTTVYIFYGNASITTSQENKPGVWRNGYGGVWHFGTSASLSTSDSSGNANSGTNSGATAAAGMFGGAGSFNGSSSSITIPDNSSLDPAHITVSLWFKYAGSPWANTPITKPYNGPTWGNPYVSNLLRVDFYGSNMEFDAGNGSTYSNYQPAYTTVPGDWYYALYTYDGTTLSAYMNGSLVGTNTSVSGNIAYDGYGSPPWIIGADYSIGYGYFDGLIDEVHISSTARSADWIATEYANQSSPSSFFHVTGTGSSGGGSSNPNITNLSPTSGPVGTVVTITGTNFGSTQGSSTVTFDGVAATPTSWSATSIIVPVPAGATIGNVVVTVGGAASNGMAFTVTGSGTSSTSLTSNLQPSNYGSPVTFTATVTPTPSGPSETVTFFDFNGNVTLAANVPLNSSGVATLNITTLAPGSHSIWATYNGDANHAPSTSAVLGQTVTRNPMSLPPYAVH